MPLINTEVKLMLTWSANCVVTAAAGATNFAITETKLYVPVVTLASGDNGKLLQQLKSGFKRFVFWNEYLSKQDDVVNANAGYDFLIDPSFQGSNRFFVLPFLIGGDRSDRTRRDYYMPTQNVTNYNVMINGKTFLDQPVNSDSRR